MSHITAIDIDSSVARGQRAEFVRDQLLQLTRRQFEKKTGISQHTLRLWESARRPISIEVTIKLIRAYQTLGVVCTAEWLIFGRSTPPMRLSDHPANLALDLRDSPHTTTSDLAELAYFHQCHPQAIDSQISDDAMLPYLGIGDRVAGIRHTGKQIETAIGEMCIVETTEQEILVRLLELGQTSEHYNLRCTNPHTLQKTVENVTLISVAPIIWIRKPLQMLRENNL